MSILVTSNKISVHFHLQKAKERPDRYHTFIKKLPLNCMRSYQQKKTNKKAPKPKTNVINLIYGAMASNNSSPLIRWPTNVSIECIDITYVSTLMDMGKLSDCVVAP